MQLIILASLLVGTVSLHPVEGRVCRTKTSTIVSCDNACVCLPAPKVKKKILKKVVVKPVVKPALCELPKAVVVAPVVVPSEPNLVVGVRGAVGLWSCNPHVFGLVGLRARLPKLHIGAEVNTQFNMGHGFQLMLYPVQGAVNWHLDVGALYVMTPFAAQDVPRRWDMTIGTGLDFRLLKWLSLTTDLRTAMPNPFDMNRLAYPDAAGRHINVGNVVGNSLLRSQLMVGLMVHTF